MEERPLFSSVEQAVEVLWPVTIRLSGLVTWLGLALLHVALVALALLALWATQTTPADVAAAVRQALQSWPGAALGVAGVSALSVLAGYWWLLRGAHRALAAPLAAHLLRDSTRR